MADLELMDPVEVDAMLRAKDLEIERLMSERDALIEAHRHLRDALKCVVEHKMDRPGLHPDVTATDLLESAIGGAEFALFQLEDKNRYPGLRDLPEIPDDDEN